MIEQRSVRVVAVCHDHENKTRLELFRLPCTEEEQHLSLHFIRAGELAEQMGHVCLVCFDETEPAFEPLDNLYLWNDIHVHQP